VLGCVEDGLLVAPGAVVGGVDMPLGMSPPAGDAMGVVVMFVLECAGEFCGLVVVDVEVQGSSCGRE
jgi:hypothetical protein